ncbi:MAG: hypothetical protein IPN32_30005 [Deltaproteobacteria bacterium]|nr:hypothetical protein [Deltaproteobacteria bacterium]
MKFEILPEGSELPEGDDAVLQDDPTQGCSVATTHPRGPAAAMLLCLAALRRRARRRTAGPRSTP